jgi:hypothetical protein
MKVFLESLDTCISPFSAEGDDDSLVESNPSTIPVAYAKLK